MKILILVALAVVLRAEDKTLGAGTKRATALPSESDRLVHMELIAGYQNMEAVIQRGRADIAEATPRQTAIRERLESMVKSLEAKAGCKLKPDLRACEDRVRHDHGRERL